MSTPGTSCLTVPHDTSATSSPVTPCRFPDDNGRSELARRPACRLVLSIHDELVYEVRGPRLSVTQSIQIQLKFNPIISNQNQFNENTSRTAAATAVNPFATTKNSTLIPSPVDRPQNVSTIEKGS